MSQSSTDSVPATRSPARRVTAGLLVLAFSLYPAVELRPDETLGIVWEDHSALFVVNPNFPVEFAGPPERQVDLLGCAADVWTDQTRADFHFEFAGETGLSGFMRDGINTVSFAEVEGNEALAVTCFFGEQGKYTDFDIVFFSHIQVGEFQVESAWSGESEPPSGTWDIGGIATHEFGHALGLGHLEDPDATMYHKSAMTGLDLRTLNPADIQCVESLYGLRQESVPGVEILSIEPPDGPPTGGNEVVLDGVNFTYPSDTRVLVGGRALRPEDFDVEDCGRIRILGMPSRDPGTVDVSVRNSIGEVVSGVTYEYVGPPLIFVRSDPNADGSHDISDALAILGMLFLGNPPVLECDKSGDFDDSGVVEITDAIGVLANLFLGLDDPVGPFPDCGTDPTPDGLPCDSFPGCE